MTITREEIAAFADGELDGAREAEVAAAIASDPDLARQVEEHRELKAMLEGHYAPIANEAVPDRLASILAPSEPHSVVDFAAARQKREQKRAIPRWSWIAGPAIAASLALAVILPRSGEMGGYADADLAAALETQLVAEQAGGAGTRILLSFRNDKGEFCRAFSSTESGGIACREDAGWKLKVTGAGSDRASSDYKMAGASDAEILAMAQDMATGPALDAAGEAAAKENGWR